MAEPATATDAVVQSVRQQFNTELPVPVSGDVAVQDTLRISVTAKGRAEAIRQAELKARKSGIVSRVRVRENQVVRAGDLLVQIDTTEYAMDLAARTAALRRAQAEYQARVLGDDGITDPRVREARDSLARGRSPGSTRPKSTIGVPSWTSRGPRCALLSGAASPTSTLWSGSTPARARTSSP